MGERGDALSLTDVGASLARARNQQTVEDDATQGESTVAEPAMAARTTKRDPLLCSNKASAVLKSAMSPVR